jgi:hypothetical protein
VKFNQLLQENNRGRRLNRPGFDAWSDLTRRRGCASTEEYPQELRDRSIRVAEAIAEDPSLTLNQAVRRIGERVGVVPDTLRGWVE